MSTTTDCWRSSFAFLKADLELVSELVVELASELGIELGIGAIRIRYSGMWAGM